MVAGLIAGAVGVVLFYTALMMTLRANSARQVPFWRNAEVIPSGSTAMRAVGAGLLVFAIVALGTVTWYWAFVIVLLGPVGAAVVIGVHNRRVRAS